MKHSTLSAALARHYAKLLGELIRLQQPPKYETRLIADRAEFAAAEADRASLMAQIETDLPHLAHVIRMFDPQWDETSVKPVRPRAQISKLGGITFAGAAIEILRDTQSPLSIREIVFAISEHYGVDVSNSDSYQKVHTAVNNGLKSTYKHVIISHDGVPQRFSLR